MKQEMNQVKVTHSLYQSRFIMLSWNMARNNIMQLTEKIFHTAPLESKSNLQFGAGCPGCFVISDMLKKILCFPVEISALEI